MNLQEIKTKAPKVMTRSEHKMFAPIFSKDIENLKEAELKKRISTSKKILEKMEAKSKAKEDLKNKKAKGIVFKKLLQRMEKYLGKLTAGKIHHEAIHFESASPEVTAQQKLDNRHKRRLSKSKAAPTTQKHLEKTPLRRLIGFQGSTTRQRQGARDKARDVG